jgi:hypothetical protein
MNPWHQRILGFFTADLSRLWVACDPDGVLLDEKLLSELRARGFEVMGYDDPFGFRAEYEERYRAAWDANEPAPSAALIVHLSRDNANDLPWDIVCSARPAVRLSLAELFPKLAYGVVRQVAASGVLGWIRACPVEDVRSRFALAEKSIVALAAMVPDADASYKLWGDFAKRYGEMLSRVHDLPGKDAGERMAAIRDRIKAIQTLSDERLQAWVAARHYAGLIQQPTTKGPVMVHHVPRFLRRRRNAGEAKVALLVFDGLAFDQWVRIREHLIVRQQPLAFDENTVFAWLPTVTSVSRQALFSGFRPREFDDSIDHTNKEESWWKAFWRHEGGVASAEVMYRRALRQVEQLNALQTEITDRKPKVLGLVIDEVDERLHKERSKEDVALWIGRWLDTGFVERLFAFLLGEGFSIYVTADHGNVDAVGVGKPNQGVIAETRGERVRVYRSESLRANSAAAYPSTISLDIAGLPANFMPLFAGGRSAFVPDGDRAVVHGGVSVEELIVPFVKVSSMNDVG